MSESCPEPVGPDDQDPIEQLALCHLRMMQIHHGNETTHGFLTLKQACEWILKDKIEDFTKIFAGWRKHDEDMCDADESEHYLNSLNMTGVDFWWKEVIGLVVERCFIDFLERGKITSALRLSSNDTSDNYEATEYFGNISCRYLLSPFKVKPVYDSVLEYYTEAFMRNDGTIEDGNTTDYEHWHDWTTILCTTLRSNTKDLIEKILDGSILIAIKKEQGRTIYEAIFSYEFWESNSYWYLVFRCNTLTLELCKYPSHTLNTYNAMYVFKHFN
jgi:hypothetical protein